MRALISPLPLLLAAVIRPEYFLVLLQTAISRRPQTMGVFMLAVLFSLVCNCHGVNPGFRTTITGKGLDYGECFEFILYSYK